MLSRQFVPQGRSSLWEPFRLFMLGRSESALR